MNTRRYLTPAVLLFALSTVAHAQPDAGVAPPPVAIYGVRWETDAATDITGPDHHVEDGSPMTAPLASDALSGGSDLVLFPPHTGGDAFTAENLPYFQGGEMPLPHISPISGTAAVPEPSTLSLVGGAAILLLRRRRKMA